MKLAIPTRNGRVDDHFGHCDHYTIFTINGKEIISREDLPSPQGCGCKSGIAKDLQDIYSCSVAILEGMSVVGIAYMQKTNQKGDVLLYHRRETTMPLKR